MRFYSQINRLIHENISSLCTYRMHILESVTNVASDPKETRKQINEKDVVDDEKEKVKNATTSSKGAIVRADDTSKSKSKSSNSDSKSSEEEKPKAREGAAAKLAENTTPESKVGRHKGGGGKSSNTESKSKSKESVDEGN